MLSAESSIGLKVQKLRSAESMKVNVLETLCLKSLVGVSRMKRVRNEEVSRNAAIKKSVGE